jgi:hypothetical protein
VITEEDAERAGYAGDEVAEVRKKGSQRVGG